ncbi:1-aminocyclopropane-1-carboxylate deaminase/D-cysteine desulfhydrase [Shewanella sp. D64]|uniref:1-aminocyclopropane-1-carboxylate deaminase/D-cysteine desulfhydrase n=1 Tax=unclassified Shewanella TaxID=196818 RepID=UPI0022BA4933|nr:MULTISPECIES: 1-aminocyclopropane-1-carboxylate deaminase/D-cysteine desulfhydrase [unclassified Shewanella]MEC4724800.1 1-aminocyclopropane-1-carboxylate deaminase/D-cysteine desulfhydrase [Shewanella sp. D64]MEC4736406.1 1-aminocyclopropane-1-carboxylate deaminase/D-cysteine desulfhydrase [Shewanella sp. E94]WBJ97535.1 1-aminocyclopropane-1-carboxylate deaminase/D-cysteine desulfhydrase [Shewanella sp. MTB7]
MKLSNTPVDSINMFDREIFIKRDDLLHPEFSGNKARKFAYFLAHDFPGANKLIGYGSPQANSLYSMSALAKLRGWDLDFYVDHIAAQIKIQTEGNYVAACQNGANVIDLSEQPDRAGRDSAQYIEEVVLVNEPNALFVPEGGRCEYAEFGVAQLAKEIIDWAVQTEHPNLTVFLPSGTGTTALFLNKHFIQSGVNIRVLTCACVGGDDYLSLQFTDLCQIEKFHPQIVSLSRKYHFGKLYRECYDMWKHVGEQGIEFELLYDPIGWLTLEEYLRKRGKQDPIMYIHQGGLLGNTSMLPRYKRKFG